MTARLGQPVIRRPRMAEVAYGPLRDCNCLAGLAGLSTGIVVAAHAPWQNLAELLADVKKRPGRSAAAMSAHQRPPLWRRALGARRGREVRLRPVQGRGRRIPGAAWRPPRCRWRSGPRRDGGQRQGTRAGHVHRAAPAVPPEGAYAEGTGLRLGGVSPIGIVAPKGLDPAVAGRLQASIRKAGSSPACQRRLAEYGLTPRPLLDAVAFTSCALAQFLREKQMLDEVGFKPE
jgi:tripartite-type tricarboxylate transporter receptor subunit TctC